MQRTTEDNIPVKVEFICAECKAGKHGCAKLWRGHGLEIRCCCSCANWRRAAAARNRGVR